ncbi:LOW QUALITY PROTEIN: hypothetical protein ColTof4_06203 [Colletotrichum tofieldiae]|nr:LOW QUALITY PROTEIN: hypothetical protein ColTof3_01386 [Colletotrichum tofieldiae]GKT73780.1 LOW QUALITY PROTEIN: hypothetical protein ColTof4_06203 [Colletotrichum tofieldiae]
MAEYRDFGTTTCDLHVDCVLAAAPESLKAKTASAAIFLGILPTTLSMIGPSTIQLTQLSARRPVLSFLIALGSIGLYLDRLFRLESPAETLSVVQGGRFMPSIQSSRWGFVVSVAEYLVVAAAALNVINLAVRLGDRSIMGFQCSMWFLPLIWVFSLTFIFLVVVIPFQFPAISKDIRNCTGADKGSRTADTGPEGPEGVQWIPLPPRNEWPPPTTIKPARQIARFPFQNSHWVRPHRACGTRRFHEIPTFEPWLTVLFNVGYVLAAFYVIMSAC